MIGEAGEGGERGYALPAVRDKLRQADGQGTCYVAMVEGHLALFLPGTVAADAFATDVSAVMKALQAAGILAHDGSRA